MPVTPLAIAAAATLAGLGIAAWILRWEAHYQLRQYRRRRTVTIDLTGRAS